MIRLSIRHCVPYSRWHIIWNILLQKTFGDIRIHRQRFLHIGESDKNWIQKKFTAKDLMAHAERHGAIEDEAHGGRKGRQAIDVAWSATLILSQIHHDHLPACLDFKDLMACFDRMIEAEANMSLRARGCPASLLKLHAKFKRSSEYFVVTNHGVSTTSNTYTKTDPHCGGGQGDGDCPPRWNCVSSDVISAYKKRAEPFQFRHPVPAKTRKFFLHAFIDDTFSALNKQTIPDLLAAVTANSQRWADYIHVTGGRLELSKCKAYFFEWKCDEDGFHIPIPQPTSNIILKDNETQELVTLTSLPLSEPYKHMGVHQCGNLSNHAEYNASKEKSDSYARGFAKSPIVGNHAYLSYKCSYAPKIHYSLPIATFSQRQCEQIHSLALSVFLPAMGFKRHFPQAVVWSPHHFGGVNLPPFYNISGLGKVNLVLRHVRSNNELGHRFLNSLANYQLYVGTSEHALSDHRPLPHANNPWITLLREYLAHINGNIQSSLFWLPSSPRHNDTYLMEGFLLIAPASTIPILNHCRLFLQVFFLSELTDDNGTFLPGALCESDDGVPILRNVHTSHLQ